MHYCTELLRARKNGSRTFSKKARLPYADFGVSLLLAKAGQQAVQRDKGLVDDVDVVDDGACTGEDAGDVVEHLTNVQEGLISVGLATKNRKRGNQFERME